MLFLAGQPAILYQLPLFQCTAHIWLSRVLRMCRPTGSAGANYDVFLSHSGAQDDGEVKRMLDYVRKDLDRLPPRRRRAFLDEASLDYGNAQAAMKTSLQGAAVGAYPFFHRLINAEALAGARLHTTGLHIHRLDRVACVCAWTTMHPQCIPNAAVALPEQQLLATSMSDACRGRSAGVVVLSADFVRGNWCMWELGLLMDRQVQQDAQHDAGRVVPAAERQIVIPYFWDLKPSDFSRIAQQYRENQFSPREHEERPTKETLELWATHIDKLCSLSGPRGGRLHSDQVGAPCCGAVMSCEASSSPALTLLAHQSDAQWCIALRMTVHMCISYCGVIADKLKAAR